MPQRKSCTLIVRSTFLCLLLLISGNVWAQQQNEAAAAE
jgi:hypothetical protein